MHLICYSLYRLVTPVLIKPTNLKHEGLVVLWPVTFMLRLPALHLVTLQILAFQANGRL